MSRKPKDPDYFPKYRKQHRESIRRNDTLRKYKLDVQQYLEMIEQQNNQCAICHKEESCKSSTGYVRPLSVDHNHETGKVRALLCMSCNTMLGYAKDNKDLLLNAIKYLEKWQ